MLPREKSGTSPPPGMKNQLLLIEGKNCRKFKKHNKNPNENNESENGVPTLKKDKLSKQKRITTHLDFVAKNRRLGGF